MIKEITAIAAAAFVGAAALVVYRLDRDNPEAVARCNQAADLIVTTSRLYDFALTDQGKRITDSDLRMIEYGMKVGYRDWDDYGCKSRPKSRAHWNARLNQPFQIK